MSDGKIDAQAARRIATLARLDPEPAQLEIFASQFNDILGHMDQLAAVDTEGVEPLYSPAQHGTVYREDKAVSRFTRDEVLANAPESDGEFFVVPKIV